VDLWVHTEIHLYMLQRALWGQEVERDTMTTRGRIPMKTISLRLDDELDAALEAVCKEQGRDKADVVTDIVRKYVEIEKLKRTLQDPALAELYQQLAVEDVALAEEGMAEYQRMLEATDQV